MCQVEADGCDRAKNHLYSGIHGDTVSTRLLSLDSRLVCWISGSLVIVRIFFSPCFFFFFFKWRIKADEFQGSSSDAGASFMLDVRSKQKLYDSSSIRARENGNKYKKK